MSQSTTVVSTVARDSSLGRICRAWAPSLYVPLPTCAMARRYRIETLSRSGLVAMTHNQRAGAVAASRAMAFSGQVVGAPPARTHRRSRVAGTLGAGLAE